MTSLLFVSTFCVKCLIHVMRLYLCFSRLFEFQMLMLQLNYGGRFKFFGILISFIFITFSETVSFFLSFDVLFAALFVCHSLFILNG